MKIRLLATVALLSVGLSGCVIDPYTMGGTNWSSPDYGSGAYYQPAPNYWVTSPTYVVRRPAPVVAAPRVYVREESRPYHDRDHDRDHDHDSRGEHHFAGR
jgi:hypothetical protein